MRILVALSGGVDSAAAAGRLRQEGAEVVGAYLRMACGDGRDAERVGERLGIRVEVVEAGKAFETVVDDFVGGYAAGTTPNPCVVCNPTVKFRRLLEVADRLGCELVATGHYARVELGGRARLLRARCRAKDQTYVLHRLSQDQLRRVVFPLGSVAGKDEVRREAAALGLEVHDKPESQDLCFAPDGDYRAVLRDQAPEVFVPGEFYDRETGTVVGTHDGTAGFTRGQRRGLPALGTPRYVVEIDAASGRIEIAARGALLQREVRARNACWVDEAAAAPGATFRVQAQIRHAGREEPGVLHVAEDAGLRMVFEEGVFAPAPGQALVAYRDDAVLAGGVIESA